MVTFTEEILNGKPYFLYSVLNFKNPQEIVDNYYKESKIDKLKSTIIKSNCWFV